jgi:hypothetical protein
MITTDEAAEKVRLIFKEVEEYNRERMRLIDEITHSCHCFTQSTSADDADIEDLISKISNSVKLYREFKDAHPPHFYSDNMLWGIVKDIISKIQIDSPELFNVTRDKHRND